MAASLDRVLPDLSPRAPRVPLVVCGHCYGLGVIETTQSIGVPPSCGECGGRGYVRVPHAQQFESATRRPSSVNAGEEVAQP